MMEKRENEIVKRLQMDRANDRLWNERNLTHANNKLVDLSVSFAVEILDLVKYLKSRHETIICNQIGRAGTSIGANIHEAQYAHGKADFASKLQIALKEANETSYWLDILHATDYLPENKFEPINSSCEEIIRILVAITKNQNK